MTPGEHAEMENLQARLDQALAEIARLTAALQEADARRDVWEKATVQIACAAAFAYGSLKGMAMTVLADSPEASALARRHAEKVSSDCRPYFDLDELVRTHGLLSPKGQA